MTVKYHINESGLVSKCSAKYCCPFGGENDHFSNKEEAERHADIINEKRANAIDLIDGKLYGIAVKGISYLKLKKRTIDNQPLSEVERIENLVKKELEDLYNRKKNINVEELKKWAKYYDELYDGKMWYLRYEYQRQKIIDPEIYHYLVTNIKQRTFVDFSFKDSDTRLDDNYTLRKKTLRKWLGKPKLAVSYKTVFDDSVIIENGTTDKPDVLATQISVYEEKTGNVIYKENLSKEEADRLGVLAPGDRLLDRLNWKYRPDKNLTPVAGKNPIYLSTEAQEELFEDIVAKKRRKLKIEKDSYDILSTRIQNYEQLLYDIKEMKKEN